MKTITLLFAIWLPALAAMAAPATKPNIVVFIADDHSQADLQGVGMVEWLPTAQAATEAKSVAFQLAAGDWRELTGMALS